ncbi:carboxymuconolactone decarboxylase family protein [Streptomyces sp. NPDC004752]
MSNEARTAPVRPFDDDDDDVLDMMGAEYVAAYRRLEAAAYRRGALTRAEQELVLLGVNGAIHLFDRDGVHRHMRRALAAGATPAEVMGVLRMALGSHTITQCVPVLLEELERVGRGVVVPASDDFTPDEQAFKERHERGRGFWYDGWNRMLRLDPEFLDAYLDLTSVSTPALAPRMRELVNIAVDVATTHLYLSGAQVHIRQALKLGVTEDEIMEVFEIVSLIGYRTMFLGLPVLRDQLSAATTDPEVHP